MYYYLARGLDIRDENLGKRAMHKRNNALYNIFYGKPRAVPLNNGDEYPYDMTFKMGLSQKSAEISEHCLEEWDKFTNYDMKGGVAKPILKLVLIKGTNTNRYITRWTWGSKDRVSCHMRWSNCRGRKAPDQKQLTEGYSDDQFENMYTFEYEDWLKIFKVEIPKDTSIPVDGIKFRFYK